MLIKGLKISGNAEHVFRKRVLHHGTLLFSSELSRLRTALDTDPELYEDKSVQSVRSNTGNIKDFLEKDMDIAEFRRLLLGHISESFDGSEYFSFRDADIGRIEELVQEKYSLWKWNIGYSPRYSLKRKIEIDKVSIRAELHVEKGQIKYCHFEGNISDLAELAIQLTGVAHDPKTIRDFLGDRNLVKPEWIDIFAEGLF